MAETFLTNKDKNELEAKIAEKVNKSELDSSDLAHIKTDYYVGNGKAGAGNPNTITFPFKPKLVFLIKEMNNISSSNLPMWSTLIYGSPIAMSCRGTNVDAEALTLTWGENKVTWYAVNGNNFTQGNEDGVTYRYVAIG